MKKDKSKNKTESKNSKKEKKAWSFSAPWSRIIMRTVIFAFAMLAVGVAMIYPMQKEWILVSPKDITDPQGIVFWMMKNVILGHGVLFASGFALAMYILPLREMKYSWWIVKQSWLQTLLHFFIFASCEVLAVGFLVYTAHDLILRPNNEGVSSLEEMLWITSWWLSVVALWIGYKSGWKAYRNIGAMTAQDRYKKDIQDMEISNSGQFWDKTISRPVVKFLGKDGGKPTGGILWICLSSILLIIMWSISIALGSTAMLAFVIFFTLPSTLGIFACITKGLDYRVKKHEPWLIPVRDWDTIDEIDIEKIGSRKFVSQ